MHDLRSSKNLIGASPSKCDVVVRHSGVRDLHALLTLAPDRASATLVPFSAADNGVCYLNERVVPVDGAAVVHGDRIAFGSRDTNSFTFEITGPSTAQQRRLQPTTNSASRISASSFRRVLDALRGDRYMTSPPSRCTSVTAHRASAATAAVVPPRPTRLNLASSPAPKQINGSSSSASSTQLDRSLLDASSDALLSEFVERKLRQSSSRRRAKPVALEPPPSLSSSNVSSVQSLSAALDNSFLDRTTQRVSTASGNGDADAPADLRLSTTERNAAEIEKLRLSQQLREVNSVRTLRSLVDADCENLRWRR